MVLSLDDPSVQAALQTVVFAAISLLSTVLAGFIGWVGVSARKWFADKKHNEAFVGATTKLEKLTRNAVAEVEQVLVRKLKAEDIWDATTAKEARDTAAEITLRHLGEHGRGVVEEGLGLGAAELLGMIRTYIEGHVRAMSSSGSEAPIVPLGK